MKIIGKMLAIIVTIILNTLAISWIDELATKMSTKTFIFILFGITFTALTILILDHFKRK